MAEQPKETVDFETLLAEKLAEQEKSFEAKHNAEMMKIRKDYEGKIADLKKQNELGKEEYARQKLEEQQQLDQQELQELRGFKKQVILQERLAKEGLPSYFKNDNRLLSAEDGNYDKVIRDIKREYEETLPKGNQYSSVVNTNTGNTPAVDDKDGLNAFGKVIENIVKN